MTLTMVLTSRVQMRNLLLGNKIWIRKKHFNRHWGYLPPLDEEDSPTYYQGDINYGVDFDGLDEEYSLEQHNLDPQEAFNRKWDLFAAIG